MDDLLGNAIKKATTYATLAGHLTLSEDTGFYIEALDGQP
jgi:inosine/xanthosine triphosphate pyrophosphatase family protein